MTLFVIAGQCVTFYQIVLLDIRGVIGYTPKMNKKVNQVLIYSPQPNPTVEEITEILKLLMYQSYPPELRTDENLTILFNKLPEGAKRHFQLKDKQ